MLLDQSSFDNIMALAYYHLSVHPNIRASREAKEIAQYKRRDLLQRHNIITSATLLNCRSKDQVVKESVLPIRLDA